MRKTKKANLENKRTLFFQIGFVISLALVLLAFEWTTVRSVVDINIIPEGATMDDDMIAIKWKKKEKIEVPKVKVPKTIEIIENTEDDGDEDLYISSEVDNATINGDPIDFDTSEEEVEDPTIFKFAQKMPEFPGGYVAMLTFLKKNIKYPQAAKEAGIQGTVYIQFIVNEEGNIVQPQVQRSIGGGCDEEALRVVKLMPKWDPGIQRTKKVKVQLSLPVNYKLNY